MEFVRLAVAVSAGATFIIGVLYLFMHWRLVSTGIPTRHTNLIFSGLCFAAVWYDVTCIGLYGSVTPQEIYPWQRAQMIALAATALLAMYFVSSLTRLGNRAVEFGFVGFYLVSSLVALAAPPGPLTWFLEPYDKSAGFPGMSAVVYHEIRGGVVPTLQPFAGLALGIYVFSLVIRFGRSGNRAAAHPMLMGMGCWAAGLANDVAVSYRLYDFIYLTEFSFLALAMGMTAALINRHTLTIRTLAESQKALALRDHAIGHSIAGLATVGMDGRVTYVNDALLSMWGWPNREAIIGRKSDDFWQDDETTAQAKSQLLSTGSWTGFLAARRTDGVSMTVQVSANVVTGDDGRPVGVVSWQQDATRRRQEEVEYRRMALMVDLAPGAVCIHDIRGGRFHYVNQRACDVHGYTREEFLALSVREIDTPSSAGRIPEIERIMLQRGEVSFEAEHRRKDGSALPMEVYARIIPWGDGQAILSISTDTTARKEAEAALREGERRFRAIFNCTFQFIGLLRPDGTLLEANQTALDFTGQSSAEIVGRPFWETGWWSGSPVRMERLRRAVERAAAGEFVRYEETLTGRGGRTMEIDFSLTPIRDESGRVALLIPEGRDITERKLAVAALQESEEKFRQMADNINTVFWIASPDWSEVLYISPAFERLWGRPVESLYRNPRLWYESVHEDDRPTLWAEVRCKMSGDFSDPVFSEYRVVRPDGSVAWVVARAFAVRDEQGRITRVAGVTEDVTEARAAREALLAAKAEVERQYGELRTLDRVKDGLLRDVTHELKTPVAKQAMFLEILRRSLERGETERVNHILGVLNDSVRRQQEVIRNLLDLSRLEAGGRRYDIRPVFLAGLVRGVAADYQVFLEQFAVELDLDLDESLEVLGDAGMLMHVVSNLLNNTIKFRKPDVPGRVRVAALAENGEALLQVSDDGTGIDAEFVPRVFDRFFQATAAVEGSGVGLSICKIVVEGMGGKIRLESPGLGRGVVVEVRLPRPAISGGVAEDPAGGLADG